MLHRPVGEAVAEGLEVLLGEQRRGREDRDLLAAGDGDEGGAQRDLGLAEADVAAHQAVHRLAGAPCPAITASIAAAWSGVSSKPKLVGEGLVVVRLECANAWPWRAARRA